MPETGETFDQSAMDTALPEPEVQGGETKMQAFRRRAREMAATAWRETKAMGKDVWDASVDSGLADELGHGVLRVGAEAAKFGLEALMSEKRKAGLALATHAVNKLEHTGHQRLSDALDRLRARGAEAPEGAVA